MNCKKYDFGIDCRSASICNVRNMAIAFTKKMYFLLIKFKLQYKPFVYKLNSPNT